MTKLSIGKIRGLQQIASRDGIFTICAMDHRDSFRSMINEENPGEVDYAEIVKRKLELCSSMAKHSSAILIDPLFGAAQCISRDILPRDTGLLVSTEATGYSGEKEHRVTELLDGWNVEKIKRMGASAVKLLIYYRPDLKELAKKQQDTVAKVARECVKFDIPFLVEPVSYPVGNEINDPEVFAEKKPELVIQTARDISALPIDVLKAEFPANLRYKKDESELTEICRQLDSASKVPWVILSAGVDFELFAREVKIACQAGASGFLGGRAIWQEAMSITDKQERIRFISTTAADRMKKISDVATKYATPWYKRYKDENEELVDISENWYQQY